MRTVEDIEVALTRFLVRSFLKDGMAVVEVAYRGVRKTRARAGHIGVTKQSRLGFTTTSKDLQTQDASSR
jgi:hypothetical protein